MKVLLINKFYYPRGGDCVYMLNLEKLLKDNGNEVAVFSSSYPENTPTVWDKYFPDEVSFSGSISDKINAAQRAISGRGVSVKFEKLLSDFKPDIIHLNNIHSYLSPVVCRLAKNKGIPVVWTLHDYKLICPAYSCLRNGDLCELCFSDSSSVLRTKCMKGNLPASIIAYLESKNWNKHRMSKLVDAFICPSHFMKKKMQQGGYSDSTFHVICNFMYDSISYTNKDREKSFCYIGRLSEEKGVETLVKAAYELKYKLYLVGDGPLLRELKDKYSTSNIIFKGKLDKDGVYNILSESHFSVMPSECYENNPLSVIESLCLGTPVLGANIGGIPELIENGKNGLTFESRNVDDLKQKIEEMFSLSFKNEEIASQSQSRFDKENYYNELMKIYNNLLR